MMTINMIFAAALIGAAVPSPSPGAEAPVLHAESEFGGAVAANDTGKIKKLTADDWQIIDGDGHIISRQTFLGVIGSGTLKHSALSSSDQTVRVYGDAAIVTGLAKSAGTYAGSAFSTDEVSTDFWIRTKNGWRCVLTQLTTLKP